ncbi:hypothetical protein D9M72_641150 [compost metagenome]
MNCAVAASSGVSLGRTAARTSELPGMPRSARAISPASTLLARKSMNFCTSAGCLVRELADQNCEDL